MLQPAGTATNNGTKGNPCLVADVLGDFREELLVRTADDTAIRIYTTTDLTPHKLFTLMHDAQYRCGVGMAETTATTSRATRPSTMQATWILAMCCRS